MENCIFCKIVSGDMPSVKIWEDETHMAFLDIFPNTEGMTLVIPKEHHNSDGFSMPDDKYVQTHLAAKKVAQILEKALKVQRVALVMEGMGVDHLHLKLYPLHGLEEKFQEMWAKDTIYFDKYAGYLSTQTGPKADFSKLEELAEKIKHSI